MSSKTLGQCCVETNFHEGTPVGKFNTVFGLDTYVTGEDSNRTVVILTDIYGHKYNNTLLLGDQFAKAGYRVYIPDILKNDPMPGSGGDLQAWFVNHTEEITFPLVDNFLKALRKEIGSGGFIGLVGYCFGAKYTIQQLAENKYGDAGAVAHPSLVEIDEVAKIKKPFLISAAEEDPIFTTELRHATEAKLAEIKAKYTITLFSGTSHGFACRGDITNPNVKFAKEKTFADQLEWFALSQKN